MHRSFELLSYLFDKNVGDAYWQAGATRAREIYK